VIVDRRKEEGRSAPLDLVVDNGEDLAEQFLGQISVLLYTQRRL